MCRVSSGEYSYVNLEVICLITFLGEKIQALCKWVITDRAIQKMGILFFSCTITYEKQWAFFIDVHAMLLFFSISNHTLYDNKNMFKPYLFFPRRSKTFFKKNKINQMLYVLLKWSQIIFKTGVDVLVYLYQIPCSITQNEDDYYTISYVGFRFLRFIEKNG